MTESKASALPTDTLHEDAPATPPQDEHEPELATVKADALALADEASTEDAVVPNSEHGDGPAVPQLRKPIEHWAEKHHGLKPREIQAHELLADSGDMTAPGRDLSKLALYKAAKVHAGWASHREVTEKEFHAAIQAFQNITCS